MASTKDDDAKMDQKVEAAAAASNNQDTSCVTRRVTLSPEPEMSSSLQDKKRSADAADHDNSDDDSVAAPPLPKRRKPVPLGPLQYPSEDQKQRILGEFETAADKALQLLLWNIGVRYSLLPHQPAAVRAVAGLPSSFPHLSAHDAGTDGMTTSQVFKAFPLESKTKGVLLADEMGLGKTVQSVVAMILRNKWYKEHGKKVLPSLIISPNFEVLTQWKETLIKAGVSVSRVKIFKPKSTTRIEGNMVLLMTRYDVQTEARFLFGKVDMRKKDNPTSPLFPTAPKRLLHKLKNQYQADKGKAKNEFKQKGESESACVARLLQSFIEEQEIRGHPVVPSFLTSFVDEAHLVKNLCSFWGLGCALLGLNSERMVPITGTPYCNGNQDLATLMAYVDPGHSASRKDWWDRITAKRVLPDVVEGLRDWREDYLIVRKKDVVLKGKIPPKFIEIIPVTPYMIELSTYEQEEERFLKIAENFRDVYDDNPLAKQRLLELFACAMACLANMRKYLLHSLLEEGRQISQQFSPSRAHMLSREQKPKECVCCKAFRDEKKDETKAPSGEDSKPPARRRRRSTTDWNMDLDDDQLNDEEFELDDEDDEDAAKGPIIALPSDVCDWSDSPCKHFAHEKCIADLREDGKSCPCCAKMPALVHLEQTMITLDGDEGESKQTGSISVSHPTYCQNIQVSPGIPGGFKASAKIQRVVEWFQTVAQDEKIIIYSFFKGSLDLMEGILTYDFGVSCARFDGDVDKKTRQADLERFKTDPSCRVLLATVQSGGTGINIVEANNVCFLDRWFNPTVHAQAEDRCHRIGQSRQVNVFYADVSTAVDEAMMYLNFVKATNASIVLADGTEFGTNQDGSLSFKELAGLFGNLIRFLQATRRTRAAANYDSPLQPVGQAALAGAAENALKPKVRAKKEAAVKSEAGADQQPSVETPAASAEATTGVKSEELSSYDSWAAAMATPHAADVKPAYQPTTIASVGDAKPNALDDSDSDDDELFANMKPTFAAKPN